MTAIDLDRVANGGQVRNLAGKPRGEDARLAFKLDEIDQQGGVVTVKVPDYIYAISSSFFLGLFSRSVMAFGTAESFLEHYRFEASDAVMRQIYHGLDRCLMSRGKFAATAHH